MLKFHFLPIVAVFLVLTFCQGVLASPVQVTFSGQIQAGNISPDYNGGIVEGDSVNGTVIYDDSAITGIGQESILLGSNSQFSLTVTIGGFKLRETDDEDYNNGFPSVEYDSGKILGLSFRVPDFETAGNFFEIFHDSFFITTADTNALNLLEGSISYTVVPLPPVFWLFVSGIGVLMWQSLKKNKSVQPALNSSNRVWF